MRALLSSDLAPVLTGGLDRHQLPVGCQICSPSRPVTHPLKVPSHTWALELTFVETPAGASLPCFPATQTPPPLPGVPGWEAGGGAEALLFGGSLPIWGLWWHPGAAGPIPIPPSAHRGDPLPEAQLGSPCTCQVGAGWAPGCLAQTVASSRKGRPGAVPAPTDILFPVWAPRETDGVLS